MKIKAIIFAVTLAAGTMLYAQPALKSGKPLKSASEDGLAPLGVLQSVASLPVGAAYLSADAAMPTVFLLSKVGVPAARGLFFSTMEGSLKSGGNFVFSAPRKVKAYWGKPSNMPTYGCVFGYKGGVMSLWAENSKTLALASFNPETRELSRIAGIPFEGLDGVSRLSATELPDGRLEVVAIVSDGSRYRVERAKDESWYDGAHIFKGSLSKGGLRRAVLRDIKAGGELKPVSSEGLVIAPTGVVHLQDSFMGADGWLVVNRFGLLVWQEASSPKAPRSFARDASGNIQTYHANGATACLLRFRSGEQVVILGGEGAIVSTSFEGMGENGPLMSAPKTVLSRNAALYTGSLGVPELVDWDGDGALDIICGNSEGRVLFFRNLGSNASPAYSGFPEPLLCCGEPFCIRPGYLGVQGPFEAIWGYMCPAVFDWNGDGMPDLVFSNALGKLEVAYGCGDRIKPEVKHPFVLKQDGLEIKGLWRVKPAVAEINGRICVVNMDGNGAFHLWRKIDESNLEDAGPLLLTGGKPITAHSGSVARDGNYGRVKINLYDWDGDGDLDLILGTPATSCIPAPDKGLPGRQPMLQVFYMENKGSDAEPRFADPLGFKVKGEDLYLGVHANAPVPCLLGDCSAGANLLVGCESGRLYWIDRRDLSTFTIKDRQKK